MSNNIFVKFFALFLLAQYLEAEEIAPQNDEITAFHDQIHPHIGTAQLSLRSMMNDIHLKTMTFQTELQTKIYETNHYIKNITDNAKNEMDSYLKTVPSQQCAGEANEEFLQLIEHIEAAKNNCIKTAENNSLPYYRSIFQRTGNLSELQTKIGETPRDCRQQNDLLQAKVNCVKATINVITDNAQIIKADIDEQIKNAKLNFLNINSDLTTCYTNQAVSMRDKVREIKETLQNCIQDQI